LCAIFKRGRPVVEGRVRQNAGDWSACLQGFDLVSNAGESAEAVARRAREKADRLLRHAELYERGAEGERIVGEILATLPPEWTVLHDVRWPGRQRANIDHIVIGPAGVFIIDSKNWSGTTALRGGLLRQNGYDRTKVVAAAIEATNAVRSVVPSLASQAFVPVLCFVGDTPISGSIGEVLICNAEALQGLLTSRPHFLSAEWLTYLSVELDMSRANARGPAAGRGRDSSPARAQPARAARRTSKSMGERRPRRRLRRFLGGLALWWVACELVYLVLGPAMHYAPAFLGPTYLVLGLLTISRATASRR
jgi:hypothetical protein